VPHIDARVPAGTTVEGIRSGRTAQRQRKKQRRRSAAALANSSATAKSAVVMQCETVRAAVPEVLVMALESGDALDVWKSKRRKKGGDVVRLGSAGSSGDVMALAGAEVLQREAVRASAPMDVTEEEVLDDYWADEGMQQAVGADAVVLRADSADAVKAMRSSLLVNRAGYERILEECGKMDTPNFGLESLHAVAARDKLREIDEVLGKSDLALAKVLEPRPTK
jgi:hypothetical protein